MVGILLTRCVPLYSNSYEQRRSTVDNASTVAASYIFECILRGQKKTWNGPNCITMIFYRMLDEKEQRTSDSSLAQLLKTDQVVSRKYNDHGGGLVNPVQVLGQIPRKSKLPLIPARHNLYAKFQTQHNQIFVASDTNLDSCNWSSKLDRPTKRVHTASSMDTIGNDNKRIKCDESTKRSSLVLEDHLLGKQASSRKTPSVTDSQLLRRLVSQQHAVLRSNDYSNESFDGRRNKDRMQTEPEVDEAEVDRGGIKGGGGDKCRRKGIENGDTTSKRNPPACNSVLMNLLVSGCDVSAGYVCFAKPKPSKSIASA